MNQIEQTLPTQDTEWEQIDSYPFKGARSKILDCILDFRDRDEFWGSIEAFDGYFDYWCNFATEDNNFLYLVIYKLADGQNITKRRFAFETGERVFPLEDYRPVGKIDLTQEPHDWCRAVVSIPQTYSYSQDKHQTYRLVKSVWDRLVERCKEALDSAVAPTENMPQQDLKPVTNNIYVDGDYVVGDKIGGDKVEGDKTTVGNISDSTGIAIGTGASANKGVDPQDKDASDQ